MSSASFLANEQLDGTHHVCSVDQAYIYHWAVFKEEAGSAALSSLGWSITVNRQAKLFAMLEDAPFFFSSSITRLSMLGWRYLSTMESYVASLL